MNILIPLATLEWCPGGILLWAVHVRVCACVIMY